MADTRVRAGDHLDVAIVGAGLSGIDAAVHLGRLCPKKSYVILEGRDDVGGTWDLFRYPGIRSDSDMYTLGYGFKPWKSRKAIADGASIKAYIVETALEHGIDRHIAFRHRVISAAWSSADARWSVSVRLGDSEEVVTFTCDMLLMCSGYYSYEEGFRPTWPGEDAYRGQIVHPQFWPDDLNYRGKDVVVIGSGATAMTLVPAMAKLAHRVTMLQRSPTYVITRPTVDPIAEGLKWGLPIKAAYALTRWKNILYGQMTFDMSRRHPRFMRSVILKGLKKHLGTTVDIDRHFTPSYNPWDQRICLVPDKDLFEVLKQDRAEIVTDTISTFTTQGIKLNSGREIKADVVVTATGLKMRLGGNVDLSVDGQRVDLAKTLNYKGCMFSDLPNLVMIFGYTNASWTLKADLVSDYFCRLLKFMDDKGVNIVKPRRDADIEEIPFFDFSSGYVQRALDGLPKQGHRKPWRIYQKYTRDFFHFHFGRIDDGTLEFRRAGGPVRQSEQSVAA